MKKLMETHSITIVVKFGWVHDQFCLGPDVYSAEIGICMVLITGG